MSGQAGIWNLDGKRVDQESLSRLDQSINAYGPDGGSHYSSGPIGMVYRAFHATPESRFENQPFVTEQGNVFTWDGRLDNRDELIPRFRQYLCSRPSDGDIVVAAYEEQQTDSLCSLVGDWALATWNGRERALVLAVDYIGIRHLYYYVGPNSVLWSTDLSSLVLLSGASLTLEDRFVAGYLTSLPEPGLTPFREFHCVAPGQFVRIDNRGAKVHSYWKFDTNSRVTYRSDAEYEEHFRHLFRQAVRRRLRSDAPILSELSGGLDSSSMVCMADEIIAEGNADTPRLDTTSSFDAAEPGCDERSYIGKVEEKRGRVGFHIDLTNRTCSFTLRCNVFCAIPGQMRNDPDSETEMDRLMKQHGYRVLLSGIGGDELLGGIPDPRPQLADMLVQFKLRDLARQLEAWSLAKRIPWIQLLLSSLAYLLPPWITRRTSDQAKVEPWIDTRFAKLNKLSLLQLGPLESFGFRLPSRQAYAQTIALIARQMIHRQQKSTACHEKRYPYLDRTLIEFLISIPMSQLIRPGERRSLMRRSLLGLVPTEILHRRTKAVVARSVIVGMRSQEQEMEKMFNRSVAARLGYIDESRFLERLRAARAGNVDHLAHLMRGLFLETWLSDLLARGLIAALDGPAPPPRAERALSQT